MDLADMGDGKKSKTRKKSKKDSQMVIRVSVEDRDAFISLCDELDTSASREIRRFMKHFVATQGESAAPAATISSPSVIEGSFDTPEIED
ncbi:MAG: hypothetical protein CME88_02335 [Hirschia sp.]|nr:hypothetical protein [Hirschia sp.]MBF17202.1 hypothetical protein [Hirschia sp.]|tara:strand:+ start:168 stop:437 length:270 start_codon:yes stop_codon:yes gene_type:complete